MGDISCNDKERYKRRSRTAQEPVQGAASCVYGYARLLVCWRCSSRVATTGAAALQAGQAVFKPGACAGKAVGRGGRMQRVQRPCRPHLGLFKVVELPFA